MDISVLDDELYIKDCPIITSIFASRFLWMMGQVFEKLDYQSEEAEYTAELEPLMP